jgi:hypothetical protein
MAIGQQRINRMHQRMKVNMIIIFILKVQNTFQGAKYASLLKFDRFAFNVCFKIEHLSSFFGHG